MVDGGRKMYRVDEAATSNRCTFSRIYQLKNHKVAEHETRMFAICHKPGMRVHFYYFYRHQPVNMKISEEENVAS